MPQQKTEDNFYEELERVFDKFPTNYIKIMLGDFNTKLDILKPTIGDESLHEISNDYGIRVVKFATSRNLRVKKTMFPHRNIHKYTRTSPDGKTHNQIDHFLVDRRRDSDVLDVRSFRAAGCDTDHYLVVAKVRERLAVNKQKSQRFHMEHKQLHQILLKYKITGYFIYVDDILIVYNQKQTNIDETIIEFNKQNSNIEFKVEKNAITPLIFWTSQYTKETKN
jgi:hypothetical protein